MTIQPLTTATYQPASDLLFSLDLDTREEINHHLDEMHKYYVAIDDDKVVGVIGWYQDTMDYARAAMDKLFPGPESYWVGFFGVAKEAQGKGVGTKLIQFLEKEVRDKGTDKLWTSAVIESTTYYQRNGFHTVTSGSVNGRPHDFMVKELL